jgi:toxin ParE1/3/4
MAAKQLDIHPAALAELKSCLSWYLARSETAGIKFVAELDRAMDLIIQSPSRWPSGEHGTRKFILRRFPFAVIYREKKPWSRYWPSPTGAGGLHTGTTGAVDALQRDHAFLLKGDVFTEEVLRTYVDY